MNRREPLIPNGAAPPGSRYHDYPPLITATAQPWLTTVPPPYDPVAAAEEDLKNGLFDDVEEVTASPSKPK